MCGQHNIRATTGDDTGQNTDKGHTSNPKIEMKISVKVWGCLSEAGVVALVFSDTKKTDKEEYLKMLKSNLHRSAEKLGIQEASKLYQDKRFRA